MARSARLCICTLGRAWSTKSWPFDRQPAVDLVDLHKDVNALCTETSNVLLDAELNRRRGVFSLARLYDHRKNPQIAKVVIASRCLTPELSAPEKATTNSDVYGALLLKGGPLSPIGVQKSLFYFSRNGSWGLKRTGSFWRQWIVVNTRSKRWKLCSSWGNDLFGNS